MVKVRDTSTNGVGLKAAQWRSFFQPRCHFGPMDVGLGFLGYTLEDHSTW